MPRINEAMDTDLKVLKGLSSLAGQRLVERRGDTLLYRQEYALSINL